MAIQCNSSSAVPRPRPVGRFVAVQAVIWVLAAPIVGAAIARLAVWAQNFRAPLLIFPLFAGCGLGLGLVVFPRIVWHRG